MEIKVLLFGIARDIAGSRQISLDLGDKTSVADLTESLKKKYPKLEGLTHFMVAVNNEYADENLEIQSGDEVAVIPPVSGG